MRGSRRPSTRSRRASRGPTWGRSDATASPTTRTSSGGRGRPGRTSGAPTSPAGTRSRGRPRPRTGPSGPPAPSDRNGVSGLNRTLMRPSALGAVLGAAVLVVTSCTAPERHVEPSAAPSAAGSLLTACALRGDLLCGTVEVPLDRANPGAGTIPIAFYVHRRTDASGPAA